MDLASGRITRVGPGVGKTSWPYFSPDGKKILFASNHLKYQGDAGEARRKADYEGEEKQREEERRTRKRRRYQWDFDPFIAIFEANPDGTSLKRLSDGKGYTAEGSYSADGKQIVFCSNRDGADDLELYIMESDGTNVRK